MKANKVVITGLTFATVFSAIPSLTLAAVLEEVIVTAQKREENLQVVPIAISAFSQKDIDELGVRNLSDIGKYTSGVEMHNSDASQPTYNIRGIQTFDFTAGSDPAVAIYVDGVYAARGAGSEIPLVDIERVEVLKGPQGTLFGRNSIGGTIHIITKKPGPDQESSLKLSAGNYNRRDVTFSHNAPITDNLAARMTLSSRRRDGWMDNIAGEDQNEENKKSISLAVGWDPAEDLSLTWRALYSDMDQISGAIPTRTHSIVNFSNPALAQADIFGAVTIDGLNAEERDLFSTSLEIVKDYERFTLTSITGYRAFNTDFWQDEDGAANQDYVFNSLNVTDDKQFSQELRLTHASDSIKWTLGGVYSRERITRNTLAQLSRSTLETFAAWEALKAGLVPGIPGVPLQTETQLAELLPLVRAQNKLLGQDGIFVSNFLSALVKPCGLATPDPLCAQLILPGVQLELQNPELWDETVRNTGTYKSAAIYGDATFSLTDKLNLSVGARYTYDQKTFSINTQYQNLFLGLPFGLVFFNSGNPVLNTQESDNWDAVSGRLVLDYNLNESLLTYASISTGFKSGGFNSLNFGPDVSSSYDSEELTNYELGVKGDFFDGRLRTNGAVFYYKYKDLQELDLIGQPIPSYNLRNADAKGSGAELDFIYALTDSVTLAGNYSYQDTEYTDYKIITAVGETEADNKTGQPRSGTPRNKVNLSAIYSSEVGSVGTLGLRVDYLYSGARLSSHSSNQPNDVSQKVPSYKQWNARVTLTSPEERLELALWGQNLRDEKVLGEFGGISTAIGSVSAWPLPPRMYGVDLLYRF